MPSLPPKQHYQQKIIINVIEVFQLDKKNQQNEIFFCQRLKGDLKINSSFCQEMVNIISILY